MRIEIDVKFNPDEIVRVYDEVEKASTNLKPVFIWAREEL